MESNRTTKNLLLGAVSLFLGALYVYLFYNDGLVLNYPVFILCVIVAGIWLSKLFAKKIGRDLYVILALGMYFSIMVFVRSSELLTFFNIVLSLFLLLLAIDLCTGKHFRSYVLPDLIKVVILPFRFIRTFFETLPLVVSLHNFSIQSGKTKEIVRGTVMAIIALAVFTWLFSGADATFAKVFNNFFNFHLSEDTLGQVVQICFVTAFFIGAFGFMFKTFDQVTTPSEGKTRYLGLIEASILLSAINVLFLTFIIVQLSALFGGQSHLTAEGLTYAEYARNGFYQLVWVAIFSFLIIISTEKLIVKNAQVHVGSFQMLSGILVVQVIAILVSAFQKLSLYENAYGFTEIRLYSHALMIWLTIALILLGHHIWKNGTQTDFAFRMFCSVVILLFAMNVLNPDAFIAKKNIERYARTGNIDTEYLANLSDDALPYTIHLLDDPKEEVQKNFAGVMYWTTIVDQNPDSWKSLRVSDLQSKRLRSD